MQESSSLLIWYEIGLLYLLLYTVNCALKSKLAQHVTLLKH